jgi:hypothetical protein
MHITEFKIEVKPQLPASIAGLAELAENLLYSWQSSIRELLIALDPRLWISCHNNLHYFYAILMKVDWRQLLRHWPHPTVHYLRRHWWPISVLNSVFTKASLFTLVD